MIWIACLLLPVSLLALFCVRWCVGSKKGMVEKKWKNTIAFIHPVMDTRETQKIRLGLIGEAQHSIVLSGSYGGGRALNDLLHVMDHVMRKRKQVTGLVMVSPVFLTRSNEGILAAMKSNFGDRFVYCVHPEERLYRSQNGRYHVLTNHVKCLSIDDGKYVIIGGSGVVSPWSECNGCITEGNEWCGEKWGFVYDRTGIMGYRDMDFLLVPCPSSNIPSEMVRSVFSQFSDELERITTSERKEAGWQILFPPVFPSVHPYWAGDVEWFFHGPDMSPNQFFTRLVEKVESSESSIVIQHMNFVPSPKLFSALLRALERGVYVTIVTNHYESGQSPLIHMGHTYVTLFWVTRLAQEACRLFSSSRLFVYYYNVPKCTYHKKVIVIDGVYVFTGSSNLTHRSEHSDYEIDVMITSSPLGAHLVQKCLPLDLKLCTPRIQWKYETLQIPFWANVACMLYPLLIKWLI